VGGQVSGRLELSTAAFRSFEVADGVNYGLTADYLLGEQYRLEFRRNQNKADVRAQPIGGFSRVTLFTLEEFPFQAGRVAPATKNAREIVVLDLSQRNLQTLRAKTSRDALAEQAKRAADQYPEAEEMWPCVARR
jgi:hypothetical protein